MKWKNSFLLILFFISAIAAFGQDVIGSWQGTLDVQGVKLRVVFHLKQQGSLYEATMDSPDQGAEGLLTTKVSFNNSTLIITATNLGIEYEGVLGGDIIQGVFKQGGKSFPLVLERQADLKLAFRPQEPIKPYPYISEEIRFENVEAQIWLAGTLTYPAKGDNFPAVVLISGSGPQNRDEELMGHKPFLHISDYLTRQGIAVLRFDDRGTANSQGDFKASTTQDFAADALAAFNYLKARKEINSKKIGLIGHSEGGLISFMLAASNKSIAFLVSMAGPAIKGDSLLYMQRKSIALAMGADVQAIDQNEQLLAKMKLIVDKVTLDSLNEKMPFFIDKVLPETLRKEESVRKEIAAQFDFLASPWMKFFMQYDPLKALKGIRCPVFAINGAKDLQVDATTNISVIEEAVKKNKLTTKIYPDLNHLFQHCVTGLPLEYGSIEETISPEVLQDISNWILQVNK